jgi:hypothetical protein
MGESMDKYSRRTTVPILIAIVWAGFLATASASVAQTKCVPSTMSDILGLLTVGLPSSDSGPLGDEEATKS